MKRVIVDHYGGPEALKVIDGYAPRPGTGKVRIGSDHEDLAAL